MPVACGGEAYYESVAKVYHKTTALSGDCGSLMTKDALAAGPHGNSLYGKHYTVLKFLAF